MWKTIKRFSNGDKLVFDTNQYAFISEKLNRLMSCDDQVSLIDITRSVILKNKEPHTGDLFFLPLLYDDTITISAEAALWLASTLSIKIETDNGSYSIFVNV